VLIFLFPWNVTEWLETEAIFTGVFILWRMVLYFIGLKNCLGCFLSVVLAVVFLGF
jgi:hypothetical protein